MKLLIDMNLSPQWCERLRAAGIEPIHWSSIGAPDADDDVLFEWAAANRAVVLTHDLGVAAIHARLRTRAPSIVLIRSDEVDPAIIGHMVTRVLRDHETALADGAILSIDFKAGSRPPIAALVKKTCRCRSFSKNFYRRKRCRSPSLKN